MKYWRVDYNHSCEENGTDWRMAWIAADTEEIAVDICSHDHIGSEFIANEISEEDYNMMVKP